MRITFWGTRGSLASPGPDTVVFGGNTTCLQVTLSSGRTIIVDAGTGIRNLGDSLSATGKKVDVYLLMSHIHWDHLLGFPFFSPIFSRDTRIVVDGCSRSLEGLKRLLSSNYVDGTWPLTFEDLQARIEPSSQLPSGKLIIDEALVESHMLHHPQGGLGFKFTEKGQSLVFLTDNELLDSGWKGACFHDFVKFCRGTDVLIHDCQYLPEEITIRKGWGHSDLDSVARLAVQAEVKRLILFHHDPWRKDDALVHMEARCRATLADAGSSVPVEAAKEGAFLEL